MFGETHERTFSAHFFLADALVLQNKISEAKEIRDRILPTLTRILGPNHRLSIFFNKPDFLDPSK